MAEPTNPTQHYKPRSHNAGTPTSRSVVSRDGIVIEENIQNELFIDRNVQRHQRASLDRQQKAKSLLDSLRGVDSDRQPTVKFSIVDGGHGSRDISASTSRQPSRPNSVHPSRQNSVQNTPSGSPLASPRNSTRPSKKKPSSRNNTKTRGITNCPCLSHILTPEI